MTETIDQVTDDNPIEDRPGAILIRDDPTGETAVRFVWVSDLWRKTTSGSVRR